MDFQDTKFNYKIIFATLVAVILGILIAFYYSYAQSKAQISYLEDERNLLVKDLTIMKSEVDRLAAMNEVNEIDLEDSRFRVEQLLDSVGRLNFTVGKLREDRRRLRKLEAMYDSLKLKNNYLEYNNSLLTEKYEESREILEELRSKSSALSAAETLLRRKNRELSRELKTKNYLRLQFAEGSGFRLRSERPIKTTKASTIEKLRGCVTILEDPGAETQQRVVYLQFLDPQMQVIEDNASTVSVSGNIYSKRVEVLYEGDEMMICDFITVPEASLQEGTYTLNVFEDEKLLTSSEFQLK
ncbi:hypothetical protein [Zeaxanthinibacter enoshimensis]|uniref:Chromosome partitioning protein ParA n=1 Tax=Zeaxanthinibacter enoshimensis TaxID=392009 RepID=A0A4R6TS02_9FLAO|nr:hypothetical protein [Zeaxanthinibacter enoshimensis]TDQ33107.1 hypothetical protein CLV82_0945 [Zeaxanthinibacter enoshimensis]